MHKNQKGFTLIELIVVIAVLAILAGVAIPKFLDVTAQAQRAAFKADVGTLRAGVANAAAASAASGGGLSYPGTLGASAADSSGPSGVVFGNVLEASAARDFFERGWRSTDGLTATLTPSGSSTAVGSIQYTGGSTGELKVVTQPQ